MEEIITITAIVDSYQDVEFLSQMSRDKNFKINHCGEITKRNTPKSMYTHAYVCVFEMTACLVPYFRDSFDHWFGDFNIPSDMIEEYYILNEYGKPVPTQQNPEH